MTTTTADGQDGMGIPCIDFVEMVTDYLDGALPPDVAEEIDAHVMVCPGCASVLEQFRVTIRQTGRLRVASVQALDPSTRDPLMAAFRHWAATRRTGEHPPRA